MSERVTCGSISGMMDARTGRPCDRSWVSNTTPHEADTAWLGPGAVPLVYADSGKHAFCFVCGARLSFAPDFSPVAEVMIQRRALDLALIDAGELEVACGEFGYSSHTPPDAEHYIAAAEEAIPGKPQVVVEGVAMTFTISGLTLERNVLRDGGVEDNWTYDENTTGVLLTEIPGGRTLGRATFTLDAGCFVPDADPGLMRLRLLFPAEEATANE